MAKKLTRARAIQARVIFLQLINVLSKVFTGGPIFAPSIINGKNKMVLYGVVSSGVGCENQQDIFPGIYIHVEYYIKWILDNMESE